MTTQKAKIFRTQSGIEYELKKVSVWAGEYGMTSGFIAISANKPARHHEGVWVFPNEFSAEEYIKKWR